MAYIGREPNVTGDSAYELAQSAQGFSGTVTQYLDSLKAAPILHSTVDPVNTQGVNGDFFVRTDTNTVFGPKAGGAWPAGVSLNGNAGSIGATGNLNREVTIYKNDTSTPSTPTTTNTVLNATLTAFTTNTAAWSLTPSTPSASQFTFVSGAVYSQTNSTGDFTIIGSTFNAPARDSGEKGNTGNTGAAATVAVNSTVTGAAGSSASVTNEGSSSAASFKFTIPKGDTGATGTAATVGVNSTVTSAAGSSASVTNEGSSSAASFKFTIPKGDTGTTGSTGLGFSAVTLEANNSAGRDITFTGSGGNSNAVLTDAVPSFVLVGTVLSINP